MQAVHLIKSHRRKEEDVYCLAAIGVRRVGKVGECTKSVSYTHLDVYKRQVF